MANCGAGDVGRLRRATSSSGLVCAVEGVPAPSSTEVAEIGLLSKDGEDSCECECECECGCVVPLCERAEMLLLCPSDRFDRLI